MLKSANWALDMTVDLVQVGATVAAPAGLGLGISIGNLIIDHLQSNSDAKNSNADTANALGGGGPIDRGHLPLSGRTGKSSKTPGGDAGTRPGKAFTPAGKKEIDRKNAEANGGPNVCVECKKSVVPGKRSERGVTPPTNERQRDHVIPKSKGGSGTVDNGAVRCRTCNGEKSDKMPDPKPDKPDKPDKPE